MTHKAVFVSRDHALMVGNGHRGSPGAVQLAPGAPEAVRRLTDDGYRVVALTNESGVARGQFDEEALDLVHGRLKQLLAERQAKLDGIYYCPYLDSAEAVVSQYHRASDLRMPRPGMLLQAADDHAIDLSASWLVGRNADAVAAGRAAGCRTILLNETNGATDVVHPDAEYVAETFNEAVELILSSPPDDRVAPPTERTYPAATPTAPQPQDADTTGDKEALASIASRLDALLDLQRQEQRVRLRRDFSTAKLLGAVCQMIALGLLLWSWIAMTEGRIDHAISRGLTTIAVQLIALTLFVLHQRD
jgi:D,D-heptose 1,7-bisphosphate phosphatase